MGDEEKCVVGIVFMEVWRLVVGGEVKDIVVMFCVVVVYIGKIGW